MRQKLSRLQNLLCCNINTKDNKIIDEDSIIMGSLNTKPTIKADTLLEKYDKPSCIGDKSIYYAKKNAKVNIDGNDVYKPHDTTKHTDTSPKQKIKTKDTLVLGDTSTYGNIITAEDDTFDGTTSSDEKDRTIDHYIPENTLTNHIKNDLHNMITQVDPEDHIQQFQLNSPISSSCDIYKTLYNYEDPDDICEKKENQDTIDTLQPLEYSRKYHKYKNINGLQPPLTEKNQNKKTLVLDLDETLIHSSFEYVQDADFDIEINLDNSDVYRVHVRKRPLVDEFLEYASKKWEIVVFTASLSTYADPQLDVLDRNNYITSRLFRESCVSHLGAYIKDLSLLGRDIDKVVIIDNSPSSYCLQPDNALPIQSWFFRKNDRQLGDLVPLLDDLAECHSIPEFIKLNKIHFKYGYYIPPQNRITYPLNISNSTLNSQQQYQQQQHQQQQQTAAAAITEEKE